MTSLGANSRLVSNAGSASPEGRFPLSVLVVCFLLAACGSRSGRSLGADDAGPDSRFTSWETERSRRQAALDAYLAANDDGLRDLLYAPLGSFGIPRVTLESFSAVMPDRWGPPGEKFAAVGLGPDLHDRDNPLPLGIAAFPSAGGELTTFSCAACHVGRVVGPDGVERLLIGAPNTRFDDVFTAFEDSAADARWSELGGGAAAATIKTALLLRRQVETRTILGITFDRAHTPNAPDPFARDRPGYFDSFATIFAMQTLPESLLPLTDAILEGIMPSAPGEADLMSLWRQDARPLAEWDGSLPDHVYRNLAAEIGAVGFGFAANLETAASVARFSSALPSPPYPFAVDSVRAARGETLFANGCADCHHDGATTIYPASFTGTDPNRANSVTSVGRERLIETLRSACTDAALCDVPDGRIVRDVAAAGSRGYMALPLHGLWARAPYLHNGSVPTLRQLLVPSSRADSFYRGSIEFDEAEIGFVWDERALRSPYVHVYDTSLAGRGNGGHSDAAFLGRDWAADPEALADLLEYLKTL